MHPSNNHGGSFKLDPRDSLRKNEQQISNLGGGRIVCPQKSIQVLLRATDGRWGWAGMRNEQGRALDELYLKKGGPANWSGPLSCPSFLVHRYYGGRGEEGVS